MSNYIRVADLTNQKVYLLGTAYSSTHTLPVLLKKLSKNTTSIILYGDESHNFLEDKYEYEKEFERVDFSYVPSDSIEWIAANLWDLNEFYELFSEYGGRRVNPLELVNRVQVYRLIQNKK